MPDPSATAAPGTAEAEIAVARLKTISADLEGCAILAADGAALAATGDLDAWAEAANGLLRAADAAAGESVSHAHVGTDDGEAFAVRHEGFALIAAGGRLTLASLMLFDMRSVLRDLARGSLAAPLRDAEAA